MLSAITTVFARQSLAALEGSGVSPTIPRSITLPIRSDRQLRPIAECPRVCNGTSTLKPAHRLDQLQPARTAARHRSHWRGIPE